MLPLLRAGSASSFSYIKLHCDIVSILGYMNCNNTEELRQRALELRHSVGRDGNRGLFLCHWSCRRHIGVKGASFCVLHANCTVRRRNDKTWYIDIGRVTIWTTHHGQLSIAHAVNNLLAPPGNTRGRFITWRWLDVETFGRVAMSGTWLQGGQDRRHSCGRLAHYAGQNDKTNTKV